MDREPTKAMRSRPILLVAIVATAACVATAPTTQVDEPSEACLLPELRTTVSGLDRITSDQRYRRVAEGILDACPPSTLHWVHLQHLERLAGRPYSARRPALIPPQATKELWLTVCSQDDLDKIPVDLPVDERGPIAYEACGWERLDVVGPAELWPGIHLGNVWSLYPYLRNHGVPHDVAKPLLRVLVFEEFGAPPESSAHSRG